jgi:hypothetical protein
MQPPTDIMLVSSGATETAAGSLAVPISASTTGAAEFTDRNKEYIQTLLDVRIQLVILVFADQSMRMVERTESRLWQCRFFCQ